MSLVQPTPPPFDPVSWLQRPFSERGRMVCESWAMQGYGTPPGIFAVYAVKVALYVAGWIFFCGFSPSLGGPSSIASWWLQPVAFEKAIVWSMVFEILGLGCGSGPLTGRHFPPVGGALYFLRIGTTKLPLSPRLPLLGGTTRRPIDVALYLAILITAARALIAPYPATEHFVALAVLVPLAGVADKTLFLAARAEHYWVTIVCFAFAPSWIAGAKAGLALGWNFGEGHLHHEQLLASIQAQCDFEEGELRCIFVESQPLGRSTLAYRIADAKTGSIERGELSVDELRTRQPWSVAQ